MKKPEWTTKLDNLDNTIGKVYVVIYGFLFLYNNKIMMFVAPFNFLLVNIKCKACDQTLNTQKCNKMSR